MNIFLISRNQTMFDSLWGKGSKGDFVHKRQSSSKLDTVTFSAAGMKMSKVASGGRKRNIEVDKTIDLQKYISEAKNSNEKELQNAGNSIDVNAVQYHSAADGFRAALTEKYSKLANEARSHADPENYIYQKYFDKSFSDYETDLNETERRIAYNYEKQMYTSGKIVGVNYQDSLFRGIEINGDVVDNDKMLFQRQTINNQISNILSNAGIDTENISGKCEFSVDPYSYQITVQGVDDSTKIKMENALNVGDNGKNLYYHILHSSTQDGCNSTQVSKDSQLKYQAYQKVYEYTGLKLNELEEKEGTYYTNEGKDILDLVNASVDESANVPKDYKSQVKNWIKELVNGISRKGWNNVSDMNLSILFGAGGLQDMHQDISFGMGSEYLDSMIGDSWYSVTS